MSSLHADSGPTRGRQLRFLAVAIGALHVLGFGLLAVAIGVHAQLASGAAFGLSLGLTAYTLGARHAFDADHVAAIDNVTRKLKGEGKESLTTGFFFALGHSTVVIALGLLVGLGARGLSGAVGQSGSTLHQVASAWGPMFAGCFLLLLAALNGAVLRDLARTIGSLRRGELSEHQLERRLESRTVLWRIYGRATGAVSRPRQLFPVGLMFGLGFDTATEVALLVLAGGVAAGGLPVWAVMSLPVLFTAGMTLCDTLNSVLMDRAYGWAFDHPLRKLYYNATITTASIAAAVVVGTVSLLGVAIDQLHLHGAVFDWIAGIDFATLGYGIVALFVALWLSALAAWRFAGIERRWERQLR